MAVFDYEQASKLAPAAARPRSGDSPCAACAVRSMTICAPLDSQELAQLSALMTPVELDAGAPLFDEGETARNVFNVTSGTIKVRSEEHTSELQSLMRISYAVFCLKKKNT